MMQYTIQILYKYYSMYNLLEYVLDINTMRMSCFRITLPCHLIHTRKIHTILLKNKILHYMFQQPNVNKTTIKDITKSPHHLIPGHNLCGHRLFIHLHTKTFSLHVNH